MQRLAAAGGRVHSPPKDGSGGDEYDQGRLFREGSFLIEHPSLFSEGHAKRRLSRGTQSWSGSIPAPGEGLSQSIFFPPKGPLVSEDVIVARELELEHLQALLLYTTCISCYC